ncbi:hypothetical protein SSP35_01_02850 [Streptomyces sp. NBRC 110611]|uniref:hypothetical protein n=1 Tax=Streptomyces sp. NBRC 110611 TaxID=1621259 RepID=UPI0008580506|nr:hypothetical protein [Streptomyces sp. NBRC 110611]GAU64948.1 hypothetical protein SSP35_01_02850 [Streptomyces sp. NBRC 110611]
MGLNEITTTRPGAGPAGPAPRSASGPPQSPSGPAEAASRFRIDIGELVLDGFDARVDPGRVTAAFQAELARLVHERGVPLAADGAGVALDGLTGLPPLPATTSPTRLGEALARAVHAGLAGRGDPR